MRLKTMNWQMEPMKVQSVHAAIYERLLANNALGIQFDCALSMRGIAHEWHEMNEVPELASQRSQPGVS